ncbi:MAG: FecR domain-containing protein [Tannerellaceae bacterium]|jgi:ferric-dicitrate binding protein FerR (iron transport regulator)|nr:FecR domain-containing protein [Tannerellaceae bacterium]
MDVDDNILIQYIDNTLSEDEKAQVETWLKASPENEKIIEQMYFVLQLTEKIRIINTVDTNKAFARFKAKRRKKVSLGGASWWLNLQRIAVVLFIPLLILTGYLLLHNDEDRLRTVEIRTNPGIVSTFDLPDGSKVWLNTNSSLTYTDNFATGERLVELKGEGYFEVVKNAKKPFVVNVGSFYSIEVLGTSFNVLAYPEDELIETTLAEGSVRIKAEAKDGNSMTCQLKPNEKAEYQKSSKQLDTRQVNTDADIGWINGEIIFKQETMRNVLKRLSYHYNVEFDVKNPEVMAAVITARFKDEQLSQVMEYLKVASGIKFSIRKPTGNKDNTKAASIVEIHP